MKPPVLIFRLMRLADRPIWIVVAAVFLLGIPFLRIGLHMDEGTYLTIAQGIIRGQVPYRDIFENKPPLAYFLLVPVISFLPRTIEAMRLAALGFFAVGCSCYYLLLRRWFARSDALLGTLFFLILSLGLDMVGLALISETVVLPVLMGFYLILLSPDKKGKRANFALGVLWTTALLINQHLIFLITPIVYGIAGQHRPCRWILAGILVVSIPVISYFVWYGAVDDLWRSVLTEPAYISRLNSGWMYVVYLFAILLPLVFIRINTPKILLAAVWGFPAIISGSIDVSYSFLTRKGIYLLPVLVYYSLYGLQKLGTRHKQVVIGSVLLAALIIKLVFLSTLSRLGVVSLYGYNDGSSPAEQGMLTYTEQRTLTQFLKERQVTNLFVYPRNIELYYLAGAKPTTRIVHFHAHKTFPYNADADRYLAELKELFLQHSPDYVVYNTRDWMEQVFTGVRDLLAEHYVKVAEFSGVEVYAKNK